MWIWLQVLCLDSWLDSYFTIKKSLKLKWNSSPIAINMQAKLSILRIYSCLCDLMLIGCSSLMTQLGNVKTSIKDQYTKVTKEIL